MKKPVIFLATLALVPGALAAETIILDFDVQNFATTPPLVGVIDYWLRKVETEASGQNKNVGLWSDPTLLNTTTAGNINRVADALDSKVSGPVPSGNSTQANELRWSFTDGTVVGPQQDTNSLNTWLRAFCTTRALVVPVFDMNQPVSVDIWTKEPLRITLNIRECPNLAGFSVGQAGNIAGSVECVGGPANTVDAVAGWPVGSRGGIELMPGVWQTVRFDLTDTNLFTVRTLSGEGVVMPGSGSDTLLGLDGFGFAPSYSNIGQVGGVKHEVYIDNVRNGTPAGEITGSMTLQGWDMSIPLKVRVEFEDGSGNIFWGGSAMTSAGGDFKIANNLPDGTYNMYVKTRSGLRKLISGVAVSGQSATLTVGQLLNGDCDDNNVTTTDDYLIISDSFDLTEGDAGYNWKADLTGDKTITTDDYLLLSDNFDITGD